MLGYIVLPTMSISNAIICIHCSAIIQWQTAVYLLSGLLSLSLISFSHLSIKALTCFAFFLTSFALGFLNFCFPCRGLASHHISDADCPLDPAPRPSPKDSGCLQCALILLDPPPWTELPFSTTCDALCIQQCTVVLTQQWGCAAHPSTPTFSWGTLFRQSSRWCHPSW